MQKFTNPNAESIFKWVFRKSDTLKIVNFYFLSRRYFSNNRHFHILENSTRIRIVVLRSLNIPFFDRFVLRIYPVIFKIWHKKFLNYEFYFGNDFKLVEKLDINCTIDLDDIEYTKVESRVIGKWERAKKLQSRYSKIVVTTDHAKNYLINKKFQSDIRVIPQCFANTFLPTNSVEVDDQKIKFCYISPLISSTGDRKSGHKNWDVTHFIEKICPVIMENPTFELHLIGRVSKNTKRKLDSKNIYFYGTRNIAQAKLIMSGCHIGLYPRIHDNFRQSQKIAEYIGVGIPIISYRLVDTDLVSKYSLGWLADSLEDFLNLLFTIDIKSFEYLEKRKNILKWQHLFSADYVAKEIEQFITES